MQTRLHRWYQQQLVAAAIILVFTAVGRRQLFPGLLIIPLLFGISGPLLTGRLRLLNRYLQLLLQPWALSFAWGSCLLFLLPLTRLAALPTLVLLVCYPLMFWPFAVEILWPVKGRLGQFLAVILFFQIAIMPRQYYGLAGVSTNGISWLLPLATTGLLGAITYSIVIIITMKQWGFLKPCGPARLNVLVLAVFLFFFLLAVYSNAMSYHGWSSLGRLTTWRLTATALEAGIGEEVLCRLALVAILYAWIRPGRGRLPFAILGSSFLFGAFHLVNLAWQTWPLTLYQLGFTTISGVFFALVFLYTGHLWLTILMHFLTDWLGLLASGTAAVSGTLTASDFSSLLTLTVVIGAMLVWMLFGKRRQLMEEHARRLAGIKEGAV